jgi:hypothetical protein
LNLSRNVAAALLLAGASTLSACSATQTFATVRGFETPVKSAIELQQTPKEGDATTLLTSADAELTKLLENGRDKLLADSIDRFEKARKEPGTIINPKNVEIEVENFAVAAADETATRKFPEDKEAHFRFTLRRAKARIVPDPTRIESEITCIENSRSPDDTIPFPQDFRAVLHDTINKTIYDLAKSKGLDPKPGRPAPER